MGIGGAGHDLSVCLIKNNKLSVAIEEERLSGEKHGIGWKSKLFRSKRYCLNACSLNEEDLDIIATNDLMNDDFIMYHFRNLPVFAINHHLAHMASAYYTSGFTTSACLVIDGAGAAIDGGKRETATLGHCTNGKFTIFRKEKGVDWELGDYFDINPIKYQMIS